MILTKSSDTKFNIDSAINEKLKTNSLHELLVIVPTNRKHRYLKKEFIDFSPGGVTGKINIDTIGTCSSRLVFNSQDRINLVDESTAVVLLKQSFKEIKLQYFSRYKKEIPNGTLSRIKNVISEYKKHGITPSLLYREAENLTGSEKAKALDIAAVFEVYRQKCNSLNAVEIGDVYFKLNNFSHDEIQTTFRQIYPTVELTIIMGFDEFTTPEVEIINSLASIKGNKLFLSFDYYLYNNLMFSHLDKCYKNLLDKGFNEIKDSAEYPDNYFETIVKQKFFRKKSGVKESKFAGDIIRLKAATREKEVELIAKEIKKLISKEHIKPNKICVTFNLIDKYSPIVRDIFSVYGIPFNLTDRYSLSSSQPVISIINLLEVLENDFYFKNIFRALSGDFIKLKGINLSNLLKASVQLKIISGYTNWCNSLKDAITKLDGTGDGEKNTADKEVYRLALQDIDKLNELLSPFSKKMKLHEFSENIERIIFSLNLPEMMINKNNSRQEENIKAVSTFLDTIHEILDLFELEFGRDEKFPLKFFLTNLRTAVSTSRFNIKEKPGYGVLITTMNEIRGLKFDNLFLSGLTDGDFPTRYTPEIFFSGSYIKNEKNHQVEERYQFYQSLCSWKNKLYLSHASREERKELSVSNLLTEFLSVFEVTEKTELDYSDTLFSKEELLIETGIAGIDNFNCYSWDVNEHRQLLNSIETDKKRMMIPQEKSEYTGYIGGTLDEVSEKKLLAVKDRQFSISQLEMYAKCPFKYFVERVLGLSVIEEPTEEIEAIEMGKLLHEILYTFYISLAQEGIDLQKSDTKEFKRAEELIFNIAEEKINAAGFYSSLAFYEKEKVLGINGVRSNSLLYKFLLAERSDDSGFSPSFFEKSFGNMEDDGNKINIKAGDVFVRGKIDRIDINTEEKTYNVVDYKLSGKSISLNDVIEGVELQLPLYMYAAKQLIKTELDQDYNPAGVEIYSLKFAEKDFGKRNINFAKKKNPGIEEKIKVNEEIIAICTELINRFVNEISSGKFNISELHNREIKVCRHCSFKGVCRVSEISD